MDYPITDYNNRNSRVIDTMHYRGYEVTGIRPEADLQIIRDFINVNKAYEAKRITRALFETVKPVIRNHATMLNDWAYEATEGKRHTIFQVSNKMAVELAYDLLYHFVEIEETSIVNEVTGEDISNPNSTQDKQIGDQ